MSNRLKFIIGSKILQGKELPMKLARAMEMRTGSGNDTYFLDLDHKFGSQSDLEQLLRSLDCDNCNNMRLVDSENDRKTRIQFERSYFIKNILDEISTNNTKIKNNPKKIVIDFSSPNIAKPFHVGHLRSTVIGNFVSNINTHFCNNAVKINYLGDWGTQFGLLKIGLREKNIDMNMLKKDPINLLYESYVHANNLAAKDKAVSEEARRYFTEVEQGLIDLNSWKEIRKFTVDELATVYRRLGVSFDIYSWESDYNAKAIESIVKDLVDIKVLKTDEHGRKVATFRNRDVVVVKSDNSSLYLSRDIAALIDRYRTYAFDEMLYVVDNSQSDHFAALFEIAQQWDKAFAEKCKHVKFGRIKGMSTRKGNVVFLKDILDEAQSKMYEKQLESPNTRSAALDDDTCDVLGTTAVIVNDLKQRRQRDYSFEWERALQTEGDTGIKLQYLHCRLWSLEKNCGFQLPLECDPNYLPEPLVSRLVAELAKFDDVLIKARDEMEACILVNYLFRLARHVNRAFNELKVKNESEDVARQRLLLFHASRLIVRKGLEILGVKPLCQM